MDVMSDEQNEIGDSHLSLRKIKKMRRENPSGWLELSMFESRALLVDAVLDTEPEVEFTHGDLAKRAGITDESVRNHIGVLIDLGLVEPVSEEGTQTYSLNQRSRVLFELESLNGAINAVRAGKSPVMDEEELLERTQRHGRRKGPLYLSEEVLGDVSQTATEAESGGPSIELNAWPSSRNRRSTSAVGGL